MHNHSSSILLFLCCHSFVTTMLVCPSALDTIVSKKTKYQGKYTKPFISQYKELLTHVPDVLSNQFAFCKRCHSDAIVPVPTTKEQFCIMGYCKQLRGDLQPRCKRTTHVALCSVGK